MNGNSHVPNFAHRTDRDFRGLRRFAGVCVAVAVLCGFGRIAAVAPGGAESATQPTEIPPGKVVSPTKALKYVGVGGCSAAACHGGPLTTEPSRLWNCSYTIWASQEPLALPENRSLKTADHAPLIDKHNRAYAVLLDERSKRIVQLLDHLPTTDAATPQKDARCVACHSVPHDPTTVPVAILADGVGCELCHGPAKNWLAKHTENRWIDSYHTGKYEPLPDMTDTRSLLSRARICAGCHVGSSGDTDHLVRDANHDLIAAGHPRLDFEFHAFLGVMPKHWFDGPDKPGSPAVKPGFKTDRETHAKAWAIGQVVAAEAALNLLAHRADENDDKDSMRPWPEFSEYDCYACHHQLDGKYPSSLQQSAKRRSGPNRLGSLPWGTWYFPEVEFLIASEPFGKWSEGFGQPLAELKTQTAKPIGSLDRTTIHISAAKAAQAMHRLADRLAEATFDPTAVDRLLLRASDEHFAPGDWDEATQRLLTLEAIWKARQFFQPQRGVSPSKDEQAIADGLDKIREKLQFPAANPEIEPSTDPRRLNPHFDSPNGFDAEVVRIKLFEPVFVRIRRLLAGDEPK
jgi:hypothetical protein